MAKFDECPECGAQLDAGEKCDCNSEKKDNYRGTRIAAERTPGSNKWLFTVRGDGSEEAKDIVAATQKLVDCVVDALFSAHQWEDGRLLKCYVYRVIAEHCRNRVEEYLKNI